MTYKTCCLIPKMSPTEADFLQSGFTVGRPSIMRGPRPNNDGGGAPLWSENHDNVSSRP